MTIGITYDETMFKRDYIGGIEKLYNIGFNHFEFCIHEKLLPIRIYELLLRTAENLGASCSFHVPNFIESSLLSADAFEIGSASHKTFEFQLDLVNDLYSDSLRVEKKSSYVFHGVERYDNSKRHTVPNRLIKFIDFVCNYIERRSLRLYPTFENTYGEHSRHFPSCTAHLNLLARAIDGYPAGICLDTAHILQVEKNLSNLEKPEFIKHIHTHGFKKNPYTSHLPLSRTGDAEFHTDIINALNAEGVPVILEIIRADASSYCDYCRLDYRLLSSLLCTSDPNAAL